MPLKTFDFAGLPLLRDKREPEDYSGYENFIPNVLESYHAPKRLKEERETAERRKKAEEMAQYFLETYGPREREADLALKENMAKNYARLAGGGVGSGIGGSMGGRRYAPTQLGKLNSELDSAVEMYGENSPQAEQYRLAIQKYTTDSFARKGSLLSSNVISSMENSNIDDLTRYSGVQGAAKYNVERAKDLAGKPSEEYLKHLEAKQAIKLEAKELRQALGESITPAAADALDKIVDATSIGKSPEAAKRQIESSRKILRKQLGNLQQSLKSTAPYGTGLPNEEGARLAQQNLIRGVINGRRVVIPRDKIQSFVESGGEVYD